MHDVNRRIELGQEQIEHIAEWGDWFKFVCAAKIDRTDRVLNDRLKESIRVIDSGLGHMMAARVSECEIFLRWFDEVSNINRGFFSKTDDIIAEHLREFTSKRYSGFYDICSG